LVEETREEIVAIEVESPTSAETGYLPAAEAA
jgi:hypothetical protein